MFTHPSMRIYTQRPDQNTENNVTYTFKGRFMKDKRYNEDYIKFMNGVLSREDTREAPAGDQDKDVKWYIPHHGIYHPKKNKIRVVFDCTAKFKRTSLNDHLFSGPVLTNNFRFRRYPYAMFHQFLMCKEDTDNLRFCWW